MIGKLTRLSLRDWLDLWPAFWRLVVVRVSLRSGIRQTQARFDGRALKAMPSVAETAAMAPWKRRALALKRVARLVPGAHCLARALALRWWMRQKGLPARLQIGVRQISDHLESHAWVEVDEQPVDETARNVATFRIISTDSQPAAPWAD